jgi:gamma-glutamylcyclotransferase (GGCT)/AIG2-like uncharacterized protein YtfP
MGKHFVFVYGTLKNMTRGKFVGEGHTVDSFYLFNGGFPLAVDPKEHDAGNNNRGYILGQLFEVDDHDMRHLDAYEGTEKDNNPETSFYFRREIPITVDGVEVTAWMYLGGEAKASIPNRKIITPDDQGFVEWPLK